MDIKPRKLNEDEIECVMQYLYDNQLPMLIIDESIRDIGEIMRIKRVADGMTLSDLSILLKMSPGTLSEIENSKRNIPRGKEKVVYDYVYKMLYIFNRLEFSMVDDEEDEDYETN